jgi:hypothetical protein
VEQESGKFLQEMEQKKDEEINEKLGEIQRLEGIIEVLLAPHATRHTLTAHATHNTTRTYRPTQQGVKMENATLKMSHQRMIEEVEALSRQLPVNRGAIRTLVYSPAPASPSTASASSSSSSSPYASPAAARGRGGAGVRGGRGGGDPTASPMRPGRPN